MASRRDELNAYTFAKRRMLASFVQPSATGSEEGAPRPLRGVVPSVIVAVVIMAGFGAWGMIKPSAPQDWDEPGEKVIIASESTTRYVVLKTDGKKQLHPVLNMASAKLLLNSDGGEVIKVDESVLDSGKVPHGPTVGIPYAPDRLPDEKDAGARKHWAVCQRPGGKEDSGSVQKAAFVFAQRDEDKTEGAGRLSGGQLLYVQGPDKTRYVVDKGGTAYPLADDPHVRQGAVGGSSTPQQVTKEWLDTLHHGDEIDFPRIEGNISDAADVPDSRLDNTANRVGMILQAPDNGRMRSYIVLPGRVAPISDFMRTLLLQDADLVDLGQSAPLSVPAGSFTPDTREFGGDLNWPSGAPRAVNSASTADGAHNTVCNVLRDVDAGNGRTTLSTWVGPAFPAVLPTGSSSAYVTPGSGQLYRQFQGSETKVGAVFLVTDTGLRYVLQSNGDSSADDSGIGESGKKKDQQAQEQKEAQIRLGYENVNAAPVPAAWSQFLPTGPRLSAAAAAQPQGS